MSNYILTADGKLYHYDASDSELYHYGVPGMKWGQRKARPVSTGVGPRRGASQQQTTSSPASSKAQSQARKAKVKKALTIGAAVAGTALAAYGAYKLNKAINNSAFKRAQDLGAGRIDAMITGELDLRDTVASRGGKYTSTALDRMRTTSRQQMVREEAQKIYNGMNYRDKVSGFVSDLKRAKRG